MITENLLQEYGVLFKAGQSNAEIAEAMKVKESSVERYRREYNARIDGEPIYEPRTPKILLFDIETLPIEAWVWHTSKQYIQPHQIKEDWRILSCAAKWMDNNVYWHDILTPAEAVARDDKRLCQGIYNMVDSADIIIAHSADRFDNRRIKSRFFMHGFNPPSPYNVIDTLKQSKKEFHMSSYALDYLAKVTANHEKIKTEFIDWVKCGYGNPEYLERMTTYNIHDVELLEEYYLKLRPWIKSHPNLALLYSDNKQVRCPACGSTNISTEDAKYGFLTPANRYPSMRCGECGAIGRMRTSNLSAEEKKYLLRSVAR